MIAVKTALEQLKFFRQKQHAKWIKRAPPGTLVRTTSFLKCTPVSALQTQKTPLTNWHIAPETVCYVVSVFEQNVHVNSTNPDIVVVMVITFGNESELNDMGTSVYNSTHIEAGEMVVIDSAMLDRNQNFKVLW